MEDGSQLIACYEFVRLLEHRLQLQRIKRTHMLPEPDDEDALRWLARSCGIGSTSSMTSIESLKKLIERASRQIHSLHNKLFFRPLLNAVALIDDETARLSPDAARRQLAVLGYQFPDRAYEHLKALASGSEVSPNHSMRVGSSIAWMRSLRVVPDASALRCSYARSGN